MVLLSTVIEGRPWRTSAGIAPLRRRPLHRLHRSSSLLLTLPLLLLAVIFSSALPMTNPSASARIFIQDRAIYDSPQNHHQSRYVIQQRLLKKSHVSQMPKWEDLGWAWGKKRADPAIAAPNTQWDDLGWAWGKKKRAMADPTTQWDALGWAWGRKKRPATAATQCDDQGWAWGKRSKQATRADKGTEWDDLGWAWGKRSSSWDQPLSIKPVPDELANEATGISMNTEHLSSKAQRAVQSLVKKNPDWHDLGWAWGR